MSFRTRFHLDSPRLPWNKSAHATPEAPGRNAGTAPGNADNAAPAASTGSPGKSTPPPADLAPASDANYNSRGARTPTLSRIKNFRFKRKTGPAPVPGSASPAPDQTVFPASRAINSRLPELPELHKLPEDLNPPDGFDDVRQKFEQELDKLYRPEPSRNSPVAPAGKTAAETTAKSAQEPVREPADMLESVFEKGYPRASRFGSLAGAVAMPAPDVMERGVEEQTAATARFASLAGAAMAANLRDAGGERTDTQRSALESAERRSGTIARPLSGEPEIAAPVGRKPQAPETKAEPAVQARKTVHFDTVDTVDTIDVIAPVVQDIVRPVVRRKETAPTRAEQLAAAQRPMLSQKNIPDKRQIVNMVEGLKNYVGQRTDNELEKFAPVKALLIAQFDRMIAVCQGDAALDHRQETELRNLCAKASEQARRLSEKHHRANLTRDSFVSAGTFYHGLSDALNEYKRLFLPVAARDESEEWIEKEEKNVKRHNPMLDKKTSSHFFKAANIGVSQSIHVASVRATLEKEKYIWKDDDLNMDMWTGYGLALQGGGSALWIVNAMIRARLLMGDIYAETPSFNELSRIDVVREANHTLFGSAGPKTRAAHLRAKQVYNHAATLLFGLGYVETPGKPVYMSDRKLNNGFDSSKLHIIMGALLTLEDNRDAHALLQQCVAALPTTATKIEPGFGDGPYVDILGQNHGVSDPVGIGPFPFRVYEFGATVGFGKFVKWNEETGAGFSAAAELRGTTMEFHLENMEPPYRLMESLYHRDLAATFVIFRKLDALVPEAGDRWAMPAKMQLYRAMQARLAGPQPERLELDAEDLYYYGAAHEIPPQFHDTIALRDINEIGRRLHVAGDQALLYFGAYRDFVENGNIFAARVESRLSHDSQLALMRSRRGAFSAINDTVWKADGDAAGAGYPEGLKQATDDPDQFLARSYDAIGMGFGCLASHIAVLKRQAVKLLEGSGDEALKQTIVAEIQRADLYYLQAKQRIGGMSLRITNFDALIKHTTLMDQGLSRRHFVRVRGEFKAGLTFSLLRAAIARSRADAANFDIENNLGQVAFSVHVRPHLARHQINPSRQGVHIEVVFTAVQGTPLGWDKIRDALYRGIKIFYPTFDTERESRQTDGFREQLQGVVFDGTSGGGYAIRLRRFPGARRVHFNLQYIRTFQTKTSGPMIAVPVALTPAGITRVHFGKQNTAQNISKERLGKDIGYLTLQHPLLEATVELARTNAEKTGVDENVVLAAMFKNEVDEVPALLAGYEGEKNLRWVAEGYFHTNKLIPAIIDRYLKYATDVETAVATGADPSAIFPDSEFHRYYLRNTKEEPFIRVATLYNLVGFHGAGSSAHLSMEGNREINTPSDPLSPPPSLRDVVPFPQVPSGRTWEELKTEIAQHEKLEGLVDFYCQPEGRPLFQFFMDILKPTKQAHDATRHRAVETLHGFQTELRNENERALAAAVSARRARAAEIRQSPPADDATAIVNAESDSRPVGE
jgi:hypothetical protein